MSDPMGDAISVFDRRIGDHDGCDPGGNFIQTWKLGEEDYRDLLLIDDPRINGFTLEQDDEGYFAAIITAGAPLFIAGYLACSVARRRSEIEGFLLAFDEQVLTRVTQED